MKENEKKQLDHHQAAQKKRKKNDHRMVHVLIRKVAQEMAGAYYEHAAGHDNQFYHHYPSQKFFIDYEWHRFIKFAKESLVEMLSNPLTPDAYKIDIHDALTLDVSLPFSYNETQITNFRH